MLYLCQQIHNINKGNSFICIKTLQSITIVTFKMTFVEKVTNINPKNNLVTLSKSYSYNGWILFLIQNNYNNTYVEIQKILILMTNIEKKWMKYFCYGIGNSHILLCAKIANIPAKAMPILSPKVVMAIENCLSSSCTFEKMHIF